MSTKTQASISTTKAHGVFGHINEDVEGRITKHISIKITRGKLAPYKDCAKSKAKQENVPKESTSKKATEVWE